MTRFTQRVTIVIVLIVCLAVSTGHAHDFPPGFQAVKIVQGINPTDMKFSPDGRFLFVTDKSGKVFLVRDDVWQTTPILNITSQIDSYNERGLNHICLDPDFASNGYVYLYYTRFPGGFNRVARFTFNLSGYTIDPASQYTLVDIHPMTATIHTGGAMNFGIDNKLYVTTGDASNPLTAQNLSSMLGKVLRMNKDGSIPTDNPYYNALTGKLRYIYAIGFRNPFSADIDRITGRYFVCDVGQNTYEEINEIVAGKNYGWNMVEGPRAPDILPPADYVDPLFSYHHSVGCAIIGGVFYNPPISSFPAEYVGKFFYGDYCNQSIKVLDPVTKQVHSTFAHHIGRPVAFAVNPDDGAFYYLDRGGMPYAGNPEDNTSTTEGVLWKVVYTGSLSPTIAAQPQSAMVSVGNTAWFTVVANGMNLNYQWRRNGEDIMGATAHVLELPGRQLTDSGDIFTCHISNPHGNITTAEVILGVTSRPPPEPVITTPEENSLYVAGTVISFSGEATDPVDGHLGANKLTWKVDFHHDEHTHPVLDAATGITSGNFSIATVGEVSDNVWYRIHLTAENGLGIKTTAYRDIFPAKVTLQLRSTVPGIPLNADGTNYPSPYNLLSVTGVTRTLSAYPSYTIADTLFTFAGWANGNTDPELVFPTPAADTVITAVYQKASIWAGTGLTGKYYTNTNHFDNLPTFTRTDTAINFNWALASPAPGVNVDGFTVRWTGQVQPRTSGLYTFYVNSNDGIRLYVNNQLLINAWTNQTTTERTATAVLAAGNKYNIQLDYFDSFDDALCELKWSGPDVIKQLIPKSSLYTLFAPLPVTFRQFTVHPKANDLQLNWVADNQAKARDYMVERRKAVTGHFAAIALVEVSNGSTYSYTDATADKNILYEYRIKQTDVDGAYTYSPTRTGLLSSTNVFDVKVVPNPVRAGQPVQLVFTQLSGTASLLLVSADGKVVRSKQVIPVSGQLAELPVQGLAAGTYYLKVVHEKDVLTKKIVIE
jgi:glucose/arabinose dehydrogenase